GIQIGGASLGVNATFFQGAVEAYQGPVHRFALGADELFSTDPAEGYSPLKMAPLEQSGARPSGVRSGLAARLELRCKDSDRELARTPALWLVAPCEGGPVSIYEDGRWDRPIGAIAPRQWSERIDLRVDTADGPVPCALRMKLLSLDAAAGRARLYVTPVCAIRDGRTAPAGAAPELDGLKTFPIPTPTFLGPYCAQRLDPDSQRELLAMNGDWHLDALRLLLRRPFDLFVFHTNEVDWAEHAVHAHYRAGVDRGTCERMIEGVYEDLDRLVGGIVDALPPGTTLLAMSQHGVVDPWQVRPGLDVALALERAGLLFRTGAGAIDYETSIAFPSAEKGFVNVRPWKPRTAGERAERKKNVRAALRALSAAVLPVSGERAFPVALPWEQAAPFGIHGPRQADILVLRPAEYGGIHGPCYPLAAGGESSLKGMFLFSGTGVRTGFREERPVWPEDLAPTAAQLLGIKPPAQSEGRVLHSMLR
ncbi:MAG: alkaline phosphatase family protein, partial [Candidatus Sumerlaeota bacterium]|nr:alkaline phosphatase family protein [Candidatus Sumerlaeota bacterium]